MKRFNKLSECIEQLEKVEYKDEIGHVLGMNVAFIQLKELVERGDIQMPNTEKLCENCKEINCRIKSSKPEGHKYCRFHIFK